MSNRDFDILVAGNVLMCRRMVDVYQPECGVIDCFECPVMEYWQERFAFLPERDRDLIFMLGEICDFTLPAELR